MRIFFLLAFVFLPALATAAEGQILHRAAERLSQALGQAICKDLRPGESQCTVSIESATHHQVGPSASLWALAWKANTVFKLKGENENTMRDALEKEQVQVLDIFPDYFTGITYFRQQAEQFEQLNSAAFSMVALNTTQKAVARISPELFRNGDLQYTLPEKWQTEGVSAGDRGAIILTLPRTAADGLALGLRDLDDAQLKGIRIESCSLREADKEVACNPENLRLRQKTSNITLQLAAEKKIKTSQPAFKLVLQEAGSTKFLLHLAIPFRPSPNYLVFGVAGFLFGGLIAVMVLFLRRKPATGTRP